MKLFTKILLLLSIIFSWHLSAQNKEAIKKLQVQLLKTNLEDSAKARIYTTLADEFVRDNNDSTQLYIKLSEKYLAKSPAKQIGLKNNYLKSLSWYFQSSFDSSLHYINKCLIDASPEKDKILLSKVFNLKGAINFRLGNYNEAEKQYLKNLQIVTDLKDTASILSAYYNISLIHNSQGDFSKAIEYNYKVLELAEVINDDQSILLGSQGLAISYYSVNELKNAIFYLNKAYKIALDNNWKTDQIGILIDFGNAYRYGKNYNKAIYFNDKAIDLAKSLNDEIRLSVAISNKAACYINTKNYLEADKLSLQSLEMSKKIGFLDGEMQNYVTLAESKYLQNDYTLARTYALKVLQISKELGAIDDERSSYDVLYKIYNSLKMSDSALIYLRKHIQLKDSFINETNLKRIAVNEYLYQKQKEDKLQKLEKKFIENELAKQKLVKTIVSIAAIILLALLVFLYKTFRDKQHASKEIEKQKQTIEEKNRNIVDSINYSRYIQQALLPSEEEISKLLNDTFVYYLPKDIVSGDFYFVGQPNNNPNGNLVVFGVGDCTGHGVPGAFLTVLGKTFIELGLSEKSVENCAAALNYLNKGVSTILNKKSSTRKVVLDGMDIALCALNKDKLILEYAGAKNDILIVKNNSIEVIKADKNAIGEFQDAVLPEYTNHEIQLSKGDIIYVFTDGIVDQFGGTDGKKYKIKNFKNFLLSIKDLPMKDQKIKLEYEFNNWKGALEQLDDVCVLGVRV